MQLEFANEAALWALISIPLFAYFLWLPSRQAPLSFSWRRWALLSCAFAVCILGLSRPQVGRRVTESKSLRSQLILMVDISRSMSAQDVAPSRLGFAVAFAQRLLQQLGSTKVAIFPFTLDGFVQMPLTSDLAAAADMLSSLTPNTMTAQGTDLSGSLEGLLLTLNRMQHAVERNGGDWLPTQVVLLSDGETHYPVRDEISREFRRRRIPIFTVGIGTPEGASIPVEGRFTNQREWLRDNSGKLVKSQLHGEHLRRIAEQSGGDHYSSRFEEVYRVSKQLSQSMQLGKLTTSFKTDRELFPFLFGLALLLFLIEFGKLRWQYALRSTLWVTLVFSSLATAAPEPSADPEVRAIEAYNAGVKYLEQNNPARAADLFQESALLSESKKVRKQALYNLGNSYMRLMDPVQAINSYQEALEIHSGDSKFEQEANTRTYDNYVLARRLLKKMQKQPSDGEGKSGKDDGKDKKGKGEEDRKGPQKDYQAQNFNESQRKKIFDLISSEEQQTMQRLQEDRNRRGGSRMSDKPW